MLAGELAVDQFDAAISMMRSPFPVEAGGFGIENDLSHALDSSECTARPAFRRTQRRVGPGVGPFVFHVAGVPLTQRQVI
jgi:hypothetical protein